MSQEINASPISHPLAVELFLHRVPHTPQMNEQFDACRERLVNQEKQKKIKVTWGCLHRRTFLSGNRGVKS
jgi:predicted SpoU family rRNA methylase